MAETKLTAEKILAIRKAARTGEKTAEEVAAEVGVNPWDCQRIAKEIGRSFLGKQGGTGARGSNSEEQNDRIRAGQKRAKGRREGIEA